MYKTSIIIADLNEKKNPEYYLKFVNSETRDTLAQLKKEYKAPVDIDKLQSPNFEVRGLPFLR